MNRVVASLFLVVGLFAPLTVQAIVVTPDLVFPTITNFINDPVPAGQIISDQFDDYGVVFGANVGVYNDGVPAWGGLSIFDPGIAVDPFGAVTRTDGVTAISGRFVVPNTVTSAVTTILTVHIGLAQAAETMKLEVKDINGNVLGTVFNDLTHDLTPTLEGYDVVTATFPGIHSFTVSRTNTTEDFALVRIAFEDPVAIPLPATLSLFVVGGIAAAGWRRRAGAPAPTAEQEE